MIILRSMLPLSDLDLHASRSGFAGRLRAPLSVLRSTFLLPLFSTSELSQGPGLPFFATLNVSFHIRSIPTRKREGNPHVCFRGQVQVDVHIR